MKKQGQYFVEVGDFTLEFIKLIRINIIFLGEFVSSLVDAIKNPKKIRVRELLYYMDTCGRQGLGIALLICFLIGLTLGAQSALQLSQFGADIYLADFVGLVMVKEVSPLMVAIICTGRAGSAFAAEIGTMKVNEEIDAMYTMGIEPFRFLAFPKVMALLICLPLLTAFGDLAGVFGGYCIGVYSLDIPATAYISQSLKAISYLDILEGIIKSGVFAFLVACIGCVQGLEASKDAQGVGKAATSTVVQGILLIIVSDCILTMIFTKLW